jgi:acetyl-CoA C-acetyltransferase
MANRVAIVGIGQTDHRARRPDVSEPELVNEAVTAALEDADMTLEQVESVFVANMDGFEGVYLSDHWMVDGAGSYLKPGFKVTTGGSTGASCTSAAFHMVASGLFDTALAVGYQKHDEGNPTAGLNCCGAPGWVREMMDGVMGGFANAAMIYMEKTGAREEHAAMVRLKADRGACANPHAQIRLGLTSVEEVMRSRVLVWPLRLLDMCPASCGACALVLASEERAKKITDRPVWIADMVTAHQEPTPGWLISETDELVAPQVAAKKIYAGYLARDDPVREPVLLRQGRGLEAHRAGSHRHRW